MVLSKALHSELNLTYTENAQLGLARTASDLVNLFGVIGGLRTRPNDVVALFENAFDEDPLLALKMAFYARDIRGGLGERLIFRNILTFLANHYPHHLLENLESVSEFGRWDDLYELIGTPCEDEMWELFATQLSNDSGDMAQGKSISLLGKWLKSVNASSEKTNALGKLTAKKLGLRVGEYRKTLSALRSYIKLVESKMSAGLWSEIEFGEVPSRAHMNYRKAFSRHQPERYVNYLESLESGEAKINAGTLYPYDIFEKMGFESGWGGRNFTFTHQDDTLELLWKNLPDYVDEGDNILVMADTSASMQGRPMATSVGLAVYFAERNTGEWKDTFMTFSSAPRLVKLTGDTLADKVKDIEAIVSNTDLRKAMKAILNVAKKHNISQEDMPKALVVISDMEIDGGGCTRNSLTFHAEMEGLYADNGYILPNVVYWNVDSRQDVFHANSDTSGVMLASGQSPSVFKAIINNLGNTPYDAMVQVLNSERYDCITLPS